MVTRAIRPLRATPPAALAALAAFGLGGCGGPPTGPAAAPRDVSTTWAYHADRGRFVEMESGRDLAPKELLAAGRALAQADDADGALHAFRAIHASPVDPSLKAEALREEARTLARAERRGEAHAAALEFFDRYPRSPLLPDALREAFVNAFAYADQSTQAGVQAVRDLLNRYPREEFSAEQAFRLAELFFSQQQYAVAAGEFDAVRREYPRSPWAEAALYRIALCALHQFKGIDYDATPLATARRHLELFLFDYPSSPLAPEAKETLARVRALQARKSMAVADYYDARGRQTGARFMYQAVASEFPDTESGAKAREILKTYPVPEPASETPLK